LATDPRPSEVGEALAEVVQRSQLLIHEEIELAKAEMTDKMTRLIKGLVIGIVAGVFAVFGLIYFLHAASWAVWRYAFGDSTNYWLGFLIVSVAIFALGALAGFLAYKFIKGGSPPAPQMAIEEGKLIKATLSGGERGAAVERQRQEVQR
jgi:uncharacterized membrane protein YqjE